MPSLQPRMAASLGGYGTESSPIVLDSDSDEGREEEEEFQFRVDFSDDNVSINKFAP